MRAGKITSAIAGKITKHAVSSRMAARSAIAMAAVCLFFGATTARASCGNPVNAPKVPAFKGAFLRQLNGGPQQGSNNTSIVGLWRVSYTLEADEGGGLFYEAFDQWHADGLEFENANLPPAYGNVCVGTWEKTGGKVKLYHVGWDFDANGNSAGSFVLTETNTVNSNGNSYEGTFDFKDYDAEGNLRGEYKGTIAAHRIAMH